MRSRKIRRKHLLIIVQADNTDDADVLSKEIKVAIHKMNRYLKDKVSYELFKNVRNEA